MQVGMELGSNRSYSENQMQGLVGSGRFSDDAERDWKCVRRVRKTGERGIYRVGK